MDAPKIVERSGFTLAGLRITPQNPAEMPALWGQFAARIGELDAGEVKACYGVCICDERGGSDTDKPAFHYMAAIEVPAERAGDLPDGFTSHECPAAKYAVFTHSDHISQISKSFEAIQQYMASSDLQATGAPELEYYDERFDPSTGSGEVDIYVPIK